MPKVHNIGPVFVQVTRFPYEWGNKLVVRGWSQEIEEPYRTAVPFIVRLPKYHGLVLGRWGAMKEEEEALSGALARREVTYDDFTEEAGWTPATESNRETSVEGLYSRFDLMDGAVNVYDWQTHLDMAEAPERG
jgi:hypothetical protein